MGQIQSRCKQLHRYSGRWKWLVLKSKCPIKRAAAANSGVVQFRCVSPRSMEVKPATTGASELQGTASGWKRSLSWAPLWRKDKAIRNTLRKRLAETFYSGEFPSSVGGLLVYERPGQVTADAKGPERNSLPQLPTSGSANETETTNFNQSRKMQIFDDFWEVRTCRCKGVEIKLNSCRLVSTSKLFPKVGYFWEWLAPTESCKNQATGLHCVAARQVEAQNGLVIVSFISPMVVW